MNPRLIAKIFLILASSALIIRLLIYIIDNNFTAKTLYYKLISPVLKY